MKNSDYLLLISFIFLLFILTWINQDKHHKEQMQEIQELKVLIQERAVKDTLYWEHLETCAFVNKDNVGIGYQGYLYDKYHRKYINK